MKCTREAGRILKDGWLMKSHNSAIVHTEELGPLSPTKLTSAETLPKPGNDEV